MEVETVMKTSYRLKEHVSGERVKLGTIVRQLTARKVTMSNTVTTRYDNKALVTFFTLVIILSLAAEAYIITDGPLWMYFVLMWRIALKY